MPHYRRLHTPGATVFFTLALADRRKSLLTGHIDRLRHAVAAVQARHPFEIDAAVVLPDHLHHVWTLPPDDTDFSTRWRLIKAHFSRGLPADPARSASKSDRQEKGIWQRRFLDHVIRDQEDLNRHVDYIHFNPVKHGHVARPVDWPYSSLHRYIKRGVLTTEWGVGYTTPTFSHAVE